MGVQVRTTKHITIRCTNTAGDLAKALNEVSVGARLIEVNVEDVHSGFDRKPIISRLVAQFEIEVDSSATGGA